MSDLFFRLPHHLKHAFAAVVSDRLNRSRDLSGPTFPVGAVPAIRTTRVNASLLDCSGIDSVVAGYLVGMYCGHRFDILGSGWIINSYGSFAPGMEDFRYDMNISVRDLDAQGGWLEHILNPAHLQESRRVWQMIRGPYSPIDWQKDVKSGYRWSSKEWYKNQTIAPAPGADIKVPWELARMQHLVQMAVFCQKFNAGNDSVGGDGCQVLCDAMIREFRNQLLDFIAANPPRMGVNWASPMEVGIRAVNILLAYDIFSQLDDHAILDDEFKKTVAGSIYAHGVHLSANLEYAGKFSNNHYLANIAGLLFIACYLDSGLKEVKAWLSASFRELLTQADQQFYRDGGSFEASTSYHRLSGEMLFYSFALILGLDDTTKEKLNGTALPGTHAELLFRIAGFTEALMKPSGEVPQIGDNDSGRFVKLTPCGSMISGNAAVSRYKNLKTYGTLYGGEEQYFDENTLDHRSFLALAAGLLENGSDITLAGGYALEKSFITALAHGVRLMRGAPEGMPVQLAGKVPAEKEYPFSRTHAISPERSGPPLTCGLVHRYFPDSGIFVFRSDRLYCAIYACPNGQNGRGGHSHNDKLSIEMNMDGKDILTDPGTYVYTALPEKRDRFRSTASHNTLVVENEEQNRFVRGRLFRLPQETKAGFILERSDRVTVTLAYRDVRQMRTIEITESTVLITDRSNRAFRTELKRQGMYSSGYGKLLNE